MTIPLAQVHLAQALGPAVPQQLRALALAQVMPDKARRPAAARLQQILLAPLRKINALKKEAFSKGNALSYFGVQSNFLQARAEKV